MQDLTISIEPLHGLNILSFDSTESQASKLIGLPDKVFMTHDNQTHFQYNQLKMLLTFDNQSNSTLTSIAVHHPDCVLKERRLIGRKQHEVLSFLSQFWDISPAIEDSGQEEKLIFRLSLTSVSFIFRFGRLDAIGVHKLLS